MKTKQQTDLFIVDDNKLFITALTNDISQVFRKDHLNIKSLVVGELVLPFINPKRTRLVILDYELNSHYSDAMNGVKILDKIKQISPNCEVIMLTSKADENLTVQSYHHGVADFIIKSREWNSKQKVEAYYFIPY